MKHTALKVTGLILISYLAYLALPSIVFFINNMITACSLKTLLPFALITALIGFSICLSTYTIHNYKLQIHDALEASPQKGYWRTFVILAKTTCAPLIELSTKSYKVMYDFISHVEEIILPPKAHFKRSEEISKQTAQDALNMSGDKKKEHKLSITSPDNSTFADANEAIQEGAPPPSPRAG